MAKRTRHPGILLKEGLERLGLRQSALASNCRISQSTLTDILKGRRRITVNMSVKLGQSLNQPPDLWAKRQLDYDVREALKRYKLKPIIEG